MDPQQSWQTIGIGWDFSWHFTFRYCLCVLHTESHDFSVH